MVTATKRNRALACIIAMVMMMTTFCVVGADKAYAKPKAPKKVMGEIYPSSFEFDPTEPIPGYMVYGWCKPVNGKKDQSKYRMQVKGKIRRDGNWEKVNFTMKGSAITKNGWVFFNGYHHTIHGVAYKNVKVRAKYKGGKWSKWKKVKFKWRPPK